MLSDVMLPKVSSFAAENFLVLVIEFGFSDSLWSEEGKWRQFGACA